MDVAALLENKALSQIAARDLIRIEALESSGYDVYTVSIIEAVFPRRNNSSAVRM